MEIVTYVLYLAILIVIGWGINRFSGKKKPWCVFLLIICGLLISYAAKQYSLISNSAKIEFIASAALLALIIITFDAAIKFRYKKLDDLDKSILKFSFVLLIINLVVLSSALILLLKLNIYTAMIIAALISGANMLVLLSSPDKKHNYALHFLEVESRMSIPLMLFFVYAVLQITTGPIDAAFSGISWSPIYLLGNAAFGIGLGLLIGLVAAKLMTWAHSKTASNLIVLLSLLVCFVLAEKTSHAGLFSVLSFGLVLGNVHIRQKESLLEMSCTLVNVLEVLVLVLFGAAINLPVGWAAFYKTALLFVCAVLIRFLCIRFLFENKFNVAEKLQTALNTPKGTAVIAALLFLFANSHIGYDVLGFAFIFVIYSLVVSTIITKSIN